MKKIYLIVVALLFIFTNNLFAQPGDNCSNAIDLAGQVSPISSTTVGAANDFSFCTMGAAADLIVYYDLPVGSTLTIQQTVNGYDSRHSLRYSGACPGTIEIVCTDDSDLSVETWQNCTGATQRVYWIQSGYASNEGTFTLAWSVVAGICPLPAVNDECSTAIPLTVNPDQLCGTVTAGTVLGATASAQNAASCAGTEDDDVWFSFVATGTTHTIDLLNITGSVTDMYHSLWTGTCPGSLTLFAGTCSDPNSQTVPGLTPGTTYFVRVYTYTSTGGQNTTFDICIGTPPPPPPNAICAGMTPICSDSPFIFTATSGGADADDTEPGNDYDCLTNSPNPTWFFMEILTSGVVAIDITAGSDIDFAMWGPYASQAAADADCGSLPTPIDCSYSASSTEQANTTAVAGEVYILLVTNYANVAQTITLNSAGSNTAATDCTILPVELTKFEGKAYGNHNLITWNTETEINNDYFILERSYEGVIFEEVVKIDGAGNSNTQLSYSYLHENPRNIEYYRLKQVDFDGKYTYSKIIAIRASKEQEVSIYPNPSKENFSFDISESKNDIYTVTYTNLMGSVLREQITITEGTNTYKVNDFKNLAQGIYFVQILNENNEVIKSQKIIKE